MMDRHTIFPEPMNRPSIHQIFRPFYHLMRLLTLVVLAGNLLGCAAKLQSAMLGSLIEDVAIATASHDDPQLVTSGVPTFLLLLEGLIEANPNDSKLLTNAAEAYTSYAALIEIEDPQRASRLYLRAKNYGLRALSQRLDNPERLHAPLAEFSLIIDELKTEDLPIVFWTATSWGAWISSNTTSMAALANLPKVIELMQWVLHQDESFQLGSPHVFLGVFHSALPKLLGGAPDKAKGHFDRAIEISEGQMLMVYVLKAKFYARQIFDRELYESLLEKTLASPVDEVAELTLQNLAAQQQARILLSQIDDFF